MSDVSRRDLLRNSVSLAVLSQLGSVQVPSTVFAADAAPATGPFEVPPLPYDYAALEPAFDSETMRLHHDKHFVAYTTKLNAAISKVSGGIANDEDLEKLLGKLSSIYDEALRKGVRNNGGGYLNHKLFFASLRAPKQDNAPTNNIISVSIKKEYGSFKAFQEKFTAAAMGLFGSGFAYLVKNNAGNLEIRTYSNQDTPAMDADGSKALLGLDVWEHAYYKKYGPKRADYVEAWWSIVDWDVVATRMA